MGGQGLEGWSIKEKGFMVMDNSVVVAGGKGYKETKCNRKNTMKN